MRKLGRVITAPFRAALWMLDKTVAAPLRGAAWVIGKVYNSGAEWTNSILGYRRGAVVIDILMAGLNAYWGWGIINETRTLAAVAMGMPMEVGDIVLTGAKFLLSSLINIPMAVGFSRAALGKMGDTGETIVEAVQAPFYAVGNGARATSQAVKKFGRKLRHAFTPAARPARKGPYVKPEFRSGGFNFRNNSQDGGN